MTFPFEVPEDLAALSAADFATFLTTVRTFAEATSKNDAASFELLVATNDLHVAVTAEETRRTELATKAKDARAQLAADLAPKPEPTPEPEPAPAPEPTPAPAPAPNPEPTKTIDEPPAVPEEQFISMVASSDVEGTGKTLVSFAAATDLIYRKISAYSSGTRPLPGTPSRQIGASNRYKIGGRSMIRHGAVAFNRNYADDLTITDGKDAMRVLEHAINEHRLPGGSLAASMQKQIDAGRALTAAAGWCAPSENIYDLCELETLDGILDLPEVQAARGGFNIPENGGPDFASIFEGIGDDGDVILTEYDVQNGSDKVCVEIPCPDFVDIRLDVAYVCLTGSFLQDRGYPEMVGRFSRGAMVALAHKVNQSVIARMVAGSGSPTTISADASGDDAGSALLSAVELAIQDIKYRNRIAQSATMEVVLPFWVLANIRAAMARRTGVALMDVTDQIIMNWFTTRKAVPRFVYDWQDAFSAGTGMGNSTHATALPTTVSFLVYPAGTWVKPVRNVINLDTIYDNALLTNNQYTALFAEDGFNVMKMCVDSRLYTVPVDVSGVVGCCP